MLNSKNKLLKKFKYTKIILFLTLAVLLLVSVSGFCKKLIVTEVKCSDQYGECIGEILQNLKSFERKPYFEANSGIKNYLRENKKVKDFFTRFNLPSVIEVDLILNKPFCMVSDDNSENIVIDENGTLLGKSESNFMPPVKISGDYSSFNTDERKKVIFACFLDKGLYYQKEIKSVLIENMQLMIDFSGDIKVIFPLEGDYRKFIGSLSLIFARFGGDEGEIILSGKTIDMRFESPVIK